MRILISNDDGIYAPGLAALAKAVETFGEVYVVAPDRERSGSSHALTLHRPVRIHERSPRWYAVEGTPTDCVNLGVLEILKDDPPQLVVSGINLGPNVGDDVMYSGTVSAAMEGALLGIPSIAISLTALNDENPNFKPAQRFAQKLIPKVLEKGLPKDSMLNVNIPNVEAYEINAVEITKLGKRRYAGSADVRTDPRGRKYYWITGEDLGFDDVEGSDAHAINHGKISVTPIRLDLTHEHLLELFQGWKL